ncbi:UNVERIFIED_CONTAM: hypothetical protein K2H54_043797 [Gekko kuhli]
MACKGTAKKCPVSYALPVPHEWYQPGDFIIGGITSQVFYAFHIPSFEEHPSQKLFDIPIIPRQTYLTNVFEINDVVSSIYQPVTDAKVNTCVLYGETFTILWLSYFMLLGAPGHVENASDGKLWIMTAQIDFALTSIQSLSDLQMFQGAISFMIHSSELPGYQHFLQVIRPCWTKRDSFIKSFWEQAFNCHYLNCSMASEGNGTCTGEERLESLPEPVFAMRMTGHSYSIYNAVYAVAHALHSMYSSRSNHRGVRDSKKDALLHLHPWKVIPPHGTTLCQ